MTRESTKERSQKLGAWLEGRSDEDKLPIAVRSSLRALPVFWNWADSSREAAEWRITPLAPLWANLSAWLVAMRPSESNKAVARQASDYCDHVAGDLCRRTDDRDDFGGGLAASAGTFAAAQAGQVKFPRQDAAHLAALYASSCGGAGVRDSNFQFLDAALRDCDLITRGTDVLSQSLWHGGANPTLNDWNALCARKVAPKPSLLSKLFKGSQSKSSQNLNIWIDWYQRTLDGRSQPHLDQLEQLSLSVEKASSK